MHAVGVYLYLYGIAGRRVRAVTQNRGHRRRLGVRDPLGGHVHFALGSGLAGLPGAALSLLGPVGPLIGSYYIVDAFLVVVLGGVGHADRYRGRRVRA